LAGSPRTVTPGPTGRPTLCQLYILRNGFVFVLSFWSCHTTLVIATNGSAVPSNSSPCRPGFPSADSPRFHSHSSVGVLAPGASWGSQSLNGCCHLSAELK